VHRGKPEEIGWQDLLDLDEDSGEAKIICITPYPKEFERGLFYAGILHVEDVDFVTIDSIESPFNAHLTQKIHTIHFHKSPPDDVRASLDSFMANLAPATAIDLPPPIQKAMAWRLKASEESARNEKQFYEQSKLLLSKALDKIHTLSTELNKLAHVDELTGLMNRRSLFDSARAILALASRDHWSVSFIMIDIDHFKTINDTWGHAAGDDTLREVAALLKASLRDSDLLARIGGEEFLVVLPQTDAAGALLLAENLRTAIAQRPLSTATQCPFPVTISLGISVAVDGKTGKMEDYLQQADQALYASKMHGRNRVSIAPC
jgi:diguanylate cyclase (GGDEF)-like protein